MKIDDIIEVATEIQELRNNYSALQTEYAKVCNEITMLKEEGYDKGFIAGKEWQANRSYDEGDKRIIAKLTTEISKLVDQQKTREIHIENLTTLNQSVEKENKRLNEEIKNRKQNDFVAYTDGFKDGFKDRDHRPFVGHT